MDAAEGCLPQALSLARRVPGPSLASRRAGLCLDRDAARYLLPRLLLDANGVDVRRRTDEPRLRCCARTLGAAGKNNSLGRTDAPVCGSAVHPMGLGQLRECGICLTAAARWEIKGGPDQSSARDGELQRR